MPLAEINTTVGNWKLQEAFKSREGTRGQSIDFRILCEPVDTLLPLDEEDIEQAVKDALPSDYDGLPRRAMRLEQESETLWIATVPYSLRESGGGGGGWILPGDPYRIAFSTSGGTQRVTHARQTIACYDAATGNSVSSPFNGAINVGPDGSPEGLDVPVPVFRYNETHAFDDDQLTTAYINAMFSLTGRMNDATFRMFAAGEALFMGADGGSRGDGTVEITFDWLGSPNVDNLAIPGTGVTVDKLGWDYLWVHYEHEVDAGGTLLSVTPRYVVIDRVHLQGDFSTLNLGS